MIKKIHVESYIKSYLYIKGFASGRRMKNTLNMLNLSRNLHDGQYRKGGDPYIIHPLRVACQLLALGIDDDVTIASAIGHDLKEDCKLSKADILDANIDPVVWDIIDTLSKDNTISTDDYYERISNTPIAAIVKLADRCHNVSTMNVFDNRKMLKYVIETQDYIYPLCRHVRNKYPQYADAVFAMKYHIRSICELATHFLEKVMDPEELEATYKEFAKEFTK